MGRPEKAKLRKLVGSPNVLFPVGTEGGRLRSVQAACEVGKVRSSFPIDSAKNATKKQFILHVKIAGKKPKKCIIVIYARTNLSSNAGNILSKAIHIRQSH